MTAGWDSWVLLAVFAWLSWRCVSNADQLMQRAVRPDGGIGHRTKRLWTWRMWRAYVLAMLALWACMLTISTSSAVAGVGVLGGAAMFGTHAWLGRKFDL